MKIPEFTVVTSGARYGADNIHACTKDGEPAVAFTCSGEVTVLPAEQVERIDVAVRGSGMCMTCLRAEDQPQPA